MKSFALALILAVVCVFTPLAAVAAPPQKIFRIGALNGSTPAQAAHMFAAFREGLRESGFVEDENVVAAMPQHLQALEERLPVGQQVGNHHDHAAAGDGLGDAAQDLVDVGLLGGELDVAADLVADGAQQRVVSAEIAVEPESRLHTYVDSFGNRVHNFDVLPPHERLVIRMRACVDTLLENPFAYPPVAAPQERDWLSERLRNEPRLWSFVLHRSRLTPDLQRWRGRAVAFPDCAAQRPLIDSVRAAMEWACDSFVCTPGGGEAASLETLLEEGTGDCTAFAHLLVAVVRSWGFAARYVAGYRHPEEEDDAAAAAKASATPCTPHAWAEVLIPGAGWLGFDPLALLVANDSYVGVAVGRDQSDAAPLRSSRKGGGESKTAVVSVRVARQQ